MVRRASWLAAILVFGMTVLCWPTAKIAADTVQPKNKGLFITPLREYVIANPNQTQTGSITIANITDKPITVTLSVEQFSVADYTYDYRFETPKEDWIKLSAVQAQLQPDKSQVIKYSVSPPANATPGGHYFTIFAATTFQKGAVNSQVRAATVLYVTVSGNLRQTSKVLDAHIPWLSFGRGIDFTLTAKNTGNTHFFVYVSGQLHGLSARNNSPEATHLLLPGATRVVGNSIPAPLLPGVYKANFGYRTDANQTIERTKYIVYIPPWSLAIPLGVAWFIIALRRHRRAQSSQQKQEE